MTQLSETKKVALITGANRGIGLQVAKELIENGFFVIVTSRKFDNAKEAAKKLGDQAYPLALDVTDELTITKAAEQVASEFGKLDLLINNAAIAHAGPAGRPLEEILAAGKAISAPIDEVRKVWDTNVFGVLAVTQAFLPLLRQASSARIVNVTSGMGSLTLNSDPNFPFRAGFGVTYGASKTAVNAITLALSLELSGTNIKVEAASPGFTATDMNNFEGTDSIEVGSKNVVRAALGQNDPDSIFSGPDGPFPW